jgi:hypothetical protein
MPTESPEESVVCVINGVSHPARNLRTGGGLHGLMHRRRSALSRSRPAAHRTRARIDALRAGVRGSSTPRVNGYRAVRIKTPAWALCVLDRLPLFHCAFA